MNKVVIAFKNKDYINIIADTMEVDKGNIIVKSDNKVVAVVKIKEIISCHLSVQHR